MDGMGTALRGERGEPGFMGPGEDFALGGEESITGYKAVTVLLQPQHLVGLAGKRMSQQPWRQCTAFKSVVNHSLS